MTPRLCLAEKKKRNPIDRLFPRKYDGAISQRSSVGCVGTSESDREEAFSKRKEQMMSEWRRRQERDLLIGGGGGEKISSKQKRVTA